MFRSGVFHWKSACFYTTNRQPPYPKTSPVSLFPENVPASIFSLSLREARIFKCLRKAHLSAIKMIITQNQGKVYHFFRMVFYGNKGKAVAGFGWICYNSGYSMD